jgi:hypothetical protein
MQNIYYKQEGISRNRRGGRADESVEPILPILRLFNAAADNPACTRWQPLPEVSVARSAGGGGV